MNEKMVINELLTLLCEFLPQCVGNCGEVATRSTNCSCPMGITYYCDDCDIPLTKLSTFKGWEDLPWSTTIRNAKKFK